jgi:hypothetical protein
MIAVRAALVAIALCVLNQPLAPRSVTDSSPSRDRSNATTFRLNSVTLRPVGFGLARSSSWTRFTAWKARPKIVLGESDQRLPEETDLGPVLSPARLNLPDSTAVATPRRPSPPPLRC